MFAVPKAMPPPTAIVTPVIQLAAREERKRQGPAMSAVSPIRFIGTARAVASAISGSRILALIFVATGHHTNVRQPSKRTGSAGRSRGAADQSAESKEQRSA